MGKRLDGLNKHATVSWPDTRNHDVTIPLNTWNDMAAVIRAAGDHEQHCQALGYCEVCVAIRKFEEGE